MKTIKKFTALLLTVILLTLPASPLLATELQVGDDYYSYTSYFLKFPDYKKVFDRFIAAAEKGDFEKANKIFSEELYPLDSYYSELYPDEVLIAEYEEMITEEGLTFSECEIDSATGTVTKVFGDEDVMAVPAIVDGVIVRNIAEGAIVGKQKLEILELPWTISEINTVFIKDCPNFCILNTGAVIISCTFYENCPSYEGEFVFFYTDTTTDHLNFAARGKSSSMLTNLGMGFAIDSGVIKGDEKGSYNWENSLTRTEAAVIILRLMGLEDEASSYSDRVCPFTDVPDWAKGYINLAVEKGVVKGRSESHFGSTESCSAKDFLTMLFRLTDLTEGEDFSWQTVLSDYQRCLTELENKRVTANATMNYNEFSSLTPISRDIHAEEFLNYCNAGGKFSRFAAAIVLYYMLDIIAGEDNVSFADILAEKYGMPDYIFYNHYVRRTDYGLSKNEKTDLTPELSHCFGNSESLLVYVREYLSDGNPYEENSEIKALAESLTAGKNSEYEKAKAISEWVAEHIFYDYDYYDGRKDEVYITPAEVLKHRYTICSGYANLTKAMLQSIGIECYIIQSLNHAWNVAVTDGKAIIIDNTWDSPLQYKYGKFSYSPYLGEETEVSDIYNPGYEGRNTYFDAKPEDFYTSTPHFPLRHPHIINREY